MAKKGEEKEYNPEKIRLTKAQADKIELEIEEKQKYLLPASAVKDAWAKMTIAFKNKLLTLPSKLAPELEVMTDKRQIEELLTDTISDALKELSQHEAGKRPYS